MAGEKQRLKPLLDEFLANVLPYAMDAQNPNSPEVNEAILTITDKIKILLGENVLNTAEVNSEKLNAIKQMIRMSITRVDGKFNVGYFKLVTIASYINSLEALDRAESNRHIPAPRL